MRTIRIAVVLVVIALLGQVLSMQPSLPAQQQPILQVSPTSLEFQGQARSPAPAPQVLTIANTGSGIMEWHASADADWIILGASGGKLSGGREIQLLVWLRIEGLEAGEYHGTVTISAEGAQGSPVQVAVTLTLVHRAVSYTVCSSGCDFPTIQAAIDAARDGDIIEIGAGSYQENLKIERSLTLRGIGQEKTIIKGREAGYPVVWIMMADEPAQIVLADMEGLTITGAHGSCANWTRGICADGVLIHDSAQVEITNCTIAANEDDGIQLWDLAQATITHSSILQNHDAGISLSPSVQAEIHDNIIEGNIGCGIDGSYGFSVRGQGRGNRMSGNGADLCGNLASTLRVPLMGASKEEISYPDDRYTNLQEAVDALVPGGRLILQDGEYEGGVTISKELRIGVAKGARVTLRGRSDNAPVLSLVGEANLKGTGLQVTGGSRGLRLGADAQASITNCTISESSEGGVRLDGSAQATITNSTILRSYFGITLGGSAQVTITNSTISENAQDGMQLGASAQAEINHSTISENRGEGIHVWGSAEATVTESTIFDTDIGILLWDSASVQIANSAISANRFSGISLEDSSQATIINSTIFRNEDAGISLFGSAQASIEGNEIIENEGYGVELHQRPCFETDKVFIGHVSGRGNNIASTEEPNGNRRGAVCPEELQFLMTEEGGEYP